jgi:predicted RNA-binding Zn ribbon-like protein
MVVVPPSPQLAGRKPAPGALALVQSFMNTRWDLASENHDDLLFSPDTLAQWLLAYELIERHVRLRDRDLRRALDVRDGLQGLARANNGGKLDSGAVARLNTAARGAIVETRLHPTGPEFVPASPNSLAGAVGVLLAIAAGAMLDGSWYRLKICPGNDCGWAFYDYSRSRSGRWCSMSVCGGRAKARAYYKRRHGTH